MCGRYTLGSEDELEGLQGILEHITYRFDAKNLRCWGKEIYPSTQAPVLNQKKELMLSKWGFDKHTGAGVIFNARSETLLQSAFWRRYVPDGRCVVPAKNYFEWEHSAGKAGAKYMFYRPGDQPLYFAGIMDARADTHNYAVITRPAAPNIRFVHDRMPLILTEDMLSAWLAPGFDTDLLQKESAQVVFQRIG